MTPQERWERNRFAGGGKCAYLPFNEMLALFRQPTLRQKDIAAMFGVSYSRIDQIYRTYFREFDEKKPLELSLHDELERRYLAAKRRKRKPVPFDKVLALFGNPEIRLKEIAQMLGVNVRMASRMYYAYFEPLLKQEACNDRVHQRSLHERRERLSRFQDHSRLAYIARAARMAGLHVERVPVRGHGWKINSTALRIDGNLCRIHIKKEMTQQSRSVKGTGRHHIHLRMSRSVRPRWDAHIVLADLPQMKRRIFVIPRYVIERRPGRKSVEVWIRMTGSRAWPAKVNWFKYENAWHLLEGE